MPLFNPNYTLPEALAVIHESLPNESAEENLINALHNGSLQAELVCQKAGSGFRIPSEVWKSTDGRFRFDIKSGAAEIWEKLIRRLTPYTGKPLGSFDRDGQFHPKYVKGEIRLARSSLDSLLDEVAALRPKQAAKINAERQCHEWASELAKGKKVWRKGDFIKEAVERHPGLSETAARRVWDANAPRKWKRPGPKS